MMEDDLLADISEEIYLESFDPERDDEVTINWKINKNVNPELSQPIENNPNQELMDIICELKGKLDIIAQNFSNEVDSPQISYLKSLITVDLSSLSMTLDNNISSLNGAVNNQQSLSTGGNTVLSEPLIFSIPIL